MVKTHRSAIAVTRHLVGAFILILMSAAYTSAQGKFHSPSVSYPARLAVSPRLSEPNPSRPAAEAATEPLESEGLRRLPPRVATTGPHPGAASVLQTQTFATLNASQQVVFPGIGFNGKIPPDANIAVGPNHIVELVNVEIGVFSKTGSTLPGYPKNLGSFWTNLGGPCATIDEGDPIVQ
jgi:hypothetical protein